MTTTSKKETTPAKKKTTAKDSKKKSSPKTGEKPTASPPKQNSKGGKSAPPPSPSKKKRATTKGGKSAPKRGNGKKKPFDKKKDLDKKNLQSHSLSHEVKKGLMAIFLLICIVGIVAMGIDIYLTRPGAENSSSGSNEPSVPHKSVTKKEALHQRKAPPANDVEKKNESKSPQ